MLNTNPMLNIKPMLNINPMFDKKGVFWFLGLTFGLTYLIDLVIYLYGGLTGPGWYNAVWLTGMMPAFSAILLGLFFLPGSPIYYRRPAGRGRWFYYFFLLYTLIIAIGVIGIWLVPSDGMIEMVSIVTQLVMVAGLPLLIGLRFAAGRQGMAGVWLAGGSWRYWLLFGLAYVAFYVLQTALNALFGLGPSEMVLKPAPQGFNPVLYTLLNAGGTVLLASVLTIVALFGEEYGWRGYLQSELFKLGRVRGVLLLGVIWGAYHWPVILMGWNYPGYPLLGLVLMVLWCTVSGVVLSYAVLKSGSILLAAFLHAVGNVIMSPIVQMGFMPFDRVFTFFIGIYGIATLAVIAFFILRDPIWQEKGGSLPQPATAEMPVSGDSRAAGKAADQAMPGTAS
jgi:membrane protease YdiL (CAAX protease family)